MSALAGFAGQVLITQTPAVSIASQNLQDSGDHTTFIVTAGNVAKRYWDNSQAIVFQTSPDGSTGWVTVTPASIKYVGGSVTFPSAVTGGTPSARILSGFYLPYTTLLEVTDWSFVGQRMLKDVTSLKGPGATDRSKIWIPLQITGQMSLNKWWIAEASEVSNLFTLLTTGAQCVLSFVTPASNRYEGYVYVKDKSIKTPVGDVVQSPITFQITGTFYAN